MAYFQYSRCTVPVLFWQVVYPVLFALSLSSFAFAAVQCYRTRLSKKPLIFKRVLYSSFAMQCLLLATLTSHAAVGGNTGVLVTLLSACIASMEHVVSSCGGDDASCWQRQLLLLVARAAGGRHGSKWRARRRVSSCFSAAARSCSGWR